MNSFITLLLLGVTLLSRFVSLERQKVFHPSFYYSTRCNHPGMTSSIGAWEDGLVIESFELFPNLMRHIYMNLYFETKKPQFSPVAHEAQAAPDYGAFVLSPSKNLIYATVEWPDQDSPIQFHTFWVNETSVSFPSTCSFSKNSFNGSAIAVWMEGHRLFSYDLQVAVYFPEQKVLNWVGLPEFVKHPGICSEYLIQSFQISQEPTKFTYYDDDGFFLLSKNNSLIHFSRNGTTEEQFFPAETLVTGLAAVNTSHLVVIYNQNQVGYLQPDISLNIKPLFSLRKTTSNIYLEHIAYDPESRLVLPLGRDNASGEQILYSYSIDKGDFVTYDSHCSSLPECDITYMNFQPTFDAPPFCPNHCSQRGFCEQNDDGDDICMCQMGFIGPGCTCNKGPVAWRINLIFQKVISALFACIFALALVGAFFDKQNVQIALESLLTYFILSTYAFSPEDFRFAVLAIMVLASIVIGIFSGIFNFGSFFGVAFSVVTLGLPISVLSFGYPLVDLSIPFDVKFYSSLGSLIISLILVLCAFYFVIRNGQSFKSRYPSVEGDTETQRLTSIAGLLKSCFRDSTKSRNDDDSVWAYRGLTYPSMNGYFKKLDSYIFLLLTCTSALLAESAAYRTHSSDYTISLESEWAKICWPFAMLFLTIHLFWLLIQKPMNGDFFPNLVLDMSLKLLVLFVYIFGWVIDLLPAEDIEKATGIIVIGAMLCDFLALFSFFAWLGYLLLLRAFPDLQVPRDSEVKFDCLIRREEKKREKI